MTADENDWAEPERKEANNIKDYAWPNESVEEEREREKG